MPIQLTAQGGDFRANVQALDAAQARQSLQKIQAHLSQPGKGTGTLTLFNRTKEGADLTLERKSGFQLLGRGARLKDTSDVLKTLLDRAGLPEARAELERHAGTRHRVGADKMLAILNRHLVDYSQLSGSSLEHLLAQAGLQRGARLGAGSFGQIFKVRGGAEPMVLKTFVAFVVGSTVIYLIGIPALSSFAFNGDLAAAITCMVPVMVWDVVKAVIAACLLPGAWLLVNKIQK